MKHLLKIIPALILIFSSCEKGLFEDEIMSNDPHTNFEYLWNECNEKYSYFDLKGINWDEVKIKYSAKLYKGMSDDSLFKVMGGMLTELRDDHTNLISNFNISNFGVTYLGQDNFDWRIITENYFNNELYHSGPFSHNFLDNKKVGYIRYPSFMNEFTDENLDFILDRYKDTKGLIIDIRENGGGNVNLVFALLSRFMEKKTLVNYSRVKTGKGHNDFSEPEPVYIKPHNGIRYKNKVAVLIDRGTFSASSFTALATKALDNMILIGDTTGGGLGLPNGGQLPNGWTYRFSISQALTLDKKPDYENGVPADIHVLFDWSNLKKDEILERAIIEVQK